MGNGQESVAPLGGKLVMMLPFELERAIVTNPIECRSTQQKKTKNITIVHKNTYKNYMSNLCLPLSITSNDL